MNVLVRGVVHRFLPTTLRCWEAEEGRPLIKWGRI